MNHELLVELTKIYNKSPIVITKGDGLVEWFNDSFAKAFPAIKTGEIEFLNQLLEFMYDESSMIKHAGMTSQSFRCLNITQKSKSMFGGLSVSDGVETLYRFEPNLIPGDEIIEKISVVNMELASLSRELSKKNREVEEANKRVNELLRTDFLTGCGNRRYFHERLEEFCSRYTRNNEKKFCVVFADLNKFKYINDTYGHDVGDAALKLFSETTRKVMRREDVFARTGGDEFAMIIECSDDRGCRHFVDKLRNATSDIRLPEHDYYLSCSFGYVISDGCIDAEKLMKEADENLYIDKNRIVS